VDKCHALVVAEVPRIPYMYRTSRRRRGDYTAPPNRTRSEHRSTRMDWFAGIRRMYGLTSPNPKRPYIKMLLVNYRSAYHSVDTKPHVIRSAIGDFIASVPIEVLHLMLEYFPVKGVSNASDET
jgi:hypothetical protein